MPASPPVGCACWPRTVRPMASAPPIRWWRPRWSRAPRPSTCWRWPVSRAPMSTSARWSVVALVVLIALGVALFNELGDDSAGPAAPAAPGVVSRDKRDADTAAALAGPRAQAALAPCPAAGTGPGPQVLRGIVVECAGDGAPVDV